MIRDLPPIDRAVPWFGARKMARSLLSELAELRRERDDLREKLTALGAMSVIEREARREALQREIAEQGERLQRDRAEAAKAVAAANADLTRARQGIVATEEVA